MCVGIFKDELMCRIDPDFDETGIEKNGCRAMDFTKRPINGYVMIDDTGIKSKKGFDYRINLSFEFNKNAKSFKKKKPLSSRDEDAIDQHL